MISIQKGSMFNKTRYSALVCTTNTVGVMGKGIALEFKVRFPAMFNDYRARCFHNQFSPGDVWTYSYPNVDIICVFTKDHWKRPSKLEWIRTGLVGLKEQIKRSKYVNVAVPPLGCGNGGLNWNVVKPLIFKELMDLNVRIDLYESMDLIDAEESAQIQNLMESEKKGIVFE